MVLSSYDPWTILGSFLIACVAGFVAFESIDHTRFSEHPRRWATAGGVTLGLGIWSMHFVGMLAWHPPFPLYYSAGRTLLSVLVAIAASVLALHLVVSKIAGTRAVANVAGAVLVGFGICMMHYIGMSALEFTNGVMWRSGWVLISLAIAIAASWAAMQMLERSDAGISSGVRRLLASIAIALAICGMHYTGMAAFMPNPGGVSVHQALSFDGPVLARIGVGNALVLTIALLAVSYRDKVVWIQMVSLARLEAQESARRLESMAAAGKIAASVAHEINNPLEAVTNLLYLIDRGELQPEQREYLATAQNELKRIANITTHTLKFYRQQSRPTRSSVPALLESALALFQTALTAGSVRVERNWPDAVPEVLCREGEIRQVIANLVSNAIDAMPAGGTLRLGITAEDNGLLVTVADTGSGIPADMRERVFEPFFTTKGLSGTGLGLSISAEILKRHGGTFTFVSPAHDGAFGTEFRFFLPYEMPAQIAAAQATVVEAASASPVSASPRYADSAR